MNKKAGRTKLLLKLARKNAETSILQSKKNIGFDTYRK